MRLIRSLLMAVMLLCFLGFALVANVGVWSLSTLVDSRAFAATSADIIAQPSVRSLLAERLADRLTDVVAPSVDIVPAIVRSRLNLRADQNRNDVRAALQTAIEAELRDPGMVTIQRSALESLHQAIVDLISSDAGSDPAAGIVLELDPVIVALDDRLDPGGKGFLGKLVPPGLGTLTIVGPGQLTVLARVVQLLEALRWLLPTLAVGAAVLVLLLARSRLHAVAWLGLCLVLVGALCMLVASGAPLIAGKLFGSHSDALASTEATLDGLTSTLITQSAVLAGLGLAMLVVGITAGMVTGRPDHRQRLDRYA